MRKKQVKSGVVAGGQRGVGASSASASSTDPLPAPRIGVIDGRTVYVRTYVTSPAAIYCAVYFFDFTTCSPPPSAPRTRSCQLVCTALAVPIYVVIFINTCP